MAFSSRFLKKQKTLHDYTHSTEPLMVAAIPPPTVFPIPIPEPEIQSKILPLKRLVSTTLLGSIDWDEDKETHLETPPNDFDLWENAARPRQLSEVVGQEAAKCVLIDWISAPVFDKAILLCGNTSSGKTSLARTLFESRDYKVWDESQLGVDDTLSDAIEMLSSRPPLFGKIKRAMLIECVEGILGDELTKLVKSLKRVTIPVILTCDSPYDRRLKSLKDTCKLVMLKPLESLHAQSILVRAAHRLNKPLSAESANTLLEASHGNVRQALNSMQFMILTKHRPKISDKTALKESDQTWDLFSCASRVCSGIHDQSMEDVSSSDLDLSLSMLQHNVVASARDLNMAAFALDSLSMSDLLLKRYHMDMAVSLGVRSVAEACRGPQRCPRMQFPSVFGKMSATQSRSKNLSIAGAGVIPTVGPMLTTSAKETCNTQSAPLLPNTTLQQVRPSAFESHEIIMLRKAQIKASGAKPKALKQCGLLLDNLAANEILTKNLF